MALSNRDGSTSADQQHKYHVFLSFRGADTRKVFAYPIFEKLMDRAINTFMDDRKLKKGTAIAENLKKAIEQSRFSIVIISENYAFSKWCLLELAHIVRSMKEDGRIIPIFYKVDPGDVRHQTGSFAKHFTEHEKVFAEQPDKVHEWRDALTKLGNLAGWDSKNRNDETAFIEEIVDSVWNNVHPMYKDLDYTQGLSGIHGVLRQIDANLDANDIRFIGIWGADEIGIQTTAGLIYTRISNYFEIISLLRDIRNLSKNKSLVYLQAQLLEQLIGEHKSVPDVYEGKLMTKNCVRNKKVLRILDDVDQSDQIQILAGEKDWYGKGSIIIITSLNRDLLVQNGIKEPYLLGVGVEQR